MRIDPNSNIEAFTKLADKTGEVQMQVGIGVMKQAMESAEAATMQLLESIQPHLGKNIDVKL
jgi:GTP cyclohydrolase III